jgi:hypothetical protein
MRYAASQHQRRLGCLARLTKPCLQPMTTFVTCTVCGNKWKFWCAQSCRSSHHCSPSLTHSPLCQVNKVLCVDGF